MFSNFFPTNRCNFLLPFFSSHIVLGTDFFLHLIWPLRFSSQHMEDVLRVTLHKSFIPLFPSTLVEPVSTGSFAVAQMEVGLADVLRAAYLQESGIWQLRQTEINHFFLLQCNRFNCLLIFSMHFFYEIPSDVLWESKVTFMGNSEWLKNLSHHCPDTLTSNGKIPEASTSWEVMLPFAGGEEALHPITVVCFMPKHPISWL